MKLYYQHNSFAGIIVLVVFVLLIKETPILGNIFIVKKVAKGS